MLGLQATGAATCLKLDLACFQALNGMQKAALMLENVKARRQCHYTSFGLLTKKKAIRSEKVYQSTHKGPVPPQK